MLTPNFDNIPDELKQYPQWVNWRSVPRKDGGKPTKPPYQPNGKLAESNNPATWSSFNTVNDVADRFDGIGFVLKQDDHFVGIDFDHCRCPAFDEIDPEISTGLNMVLPGVADHIRKLNSYTEVSPSGKGIRVFLKGKMPVDGKKKGDFEVYQAKHYLTITGHVLDGFPRTIEPRQMEVDSFYQAVFGSPEKPPELERAARTDTTPDGWRSLLERAFQSANGARIRSLWAGDHSAYSSQSEADMALTSHLAFWLAGDPVLMDTAFRESGLMSPKWDEKHYSAGGTYGAVTIEKAIAGCTSSYRDRHSQGGEQKEKSPPEAWPEPIPLSDYSHLPDFPVEAVPGVCGLMVQALAESCQVDAGLPGSMMLAVLSAAIGAQVRIVLDSHDEQGNEYLLSVLGSGNTKSAIASQLTAPLYSYQKARQLAMIPVIQKAKNKMRVLEKRLDKLEKKAANADDPDERDLLLHDCGSVLREMEENPVPTEPKYLADDVTPEKLGAVMADNDERAAILSAEGGIFQIIAGLYSKGHSNLDLFLKAHSGDPWASDRVGRESKSMDHPALTLGLLVQPSVLEEIGRNSQFRDRGLSARFLYSWCQSRAGFRTLQTSPVSASVKDSYHRLIISLMEVEGQHELRMSLDAQTIWNGFYADVESLLRPGGELEHLVDWGSKLPGAVARISGLLHFAEHGPGGIGKPISGDSLDKACLLGVYYIEHAKASFGIMKEDAPLKVVRKILSYIKRCTPKRFKGRDLFSHTSCASMDEIQPGLHILIERGHIREVDKVDYGKRTGRPESQVYEVNPKVLSNV